MPLIHPQNNKDALVRYFYLPASHGRQAEIIAVLHSRSETIEVPVREEDILLKTFFSRPLTKAELEACAGAETWLLYSSWKDLDAYHHKYRVSDSALSELYSYKSSHFLSEGMAA